METRLTEQPPMVRLCNKLSPLAQLVGRRVNKLFWHSYYTAQSFGLRCQVERGPKCPGVKEAHSSASVFPKLEKKTGIKVKAIKKEI